MRGGPTDPDLLAFLGPAADETTDEQRDDLAEALAAVAAYYDPDLPELIGAAQGGAAMLVLGDATLDELGRARQAHRGALEEATARLYGAIMAAAAAGTPEAAIAREAQVDRMTVRKVLGK